MKKNFLWGIVLGLVLFFSVNNASAASNLEVNYQTTKNSIQISWKSDAAYFQLYSGKELIWEGEDNEYKQHELNPEKQYKYYLFALNKDKQVIDQTELRVITKKDDEKVRTSVNSKSNQKEGKLDGVTIDAIISKDRVKIKWDENLPDEDGIVELYRDDKFIGEIASNEYEDKSIEPDKYYTYRVLSKEKRSADEIKKMINELESKGLEITNEILEEITYEQFDLGKIVKTFSFEEMNIKSLVQAKAYAAAAAIPQRYNFRYTTFIADAIAKVPGNPLSCPTFRGDDRSYSFDHSKYRTRTEVSVYFNGTTTASPSWVTSKVGQSARYNCNGTMDTTTQTKYTMSKTNLEATSKFASFRVVHAVGDPFDLLGILTPPVIDYTYTANVSHAGDIQVFGDHDQAPHHEMYVYIPNSDAMAVIFRHASKGLAYLAPGTTKAKIQFSIFN
ncbi:hypothetical protein [Bacillus sp. FSL K6-3431]|uniref:hypothetical protein n=1 Tax=Bacillus sp. FSL K6-3431 TaxID=2921500 RepID=UPI0030FAE0E3